METADAQKKWFSVEKLAKAYGDFLIIKLQRGSGLIGLEKAFETHQQMLLKENGPEFTYRLKNSIFQDKSPTKTMALLKKDFEIWIRMFSKLCQYYLDGGKLPYINSFNETANLMISNCNLLCNSMHEEIYLINLVMKVVLLYPDYGYDLSVDKDFERKVRATILDCNAPKIEELRRKQVVAEENFRLAC